MKTKYLKTTLITTAVLAIAIITAVLIIHYRNTEEGSIGVIKTSYDVKAPIVSLTEAEAIYDINAQNEIWSEIEDYKTQNTYTFKEPLIIQNPFQTNTQSLYIYFETDTSSSLKYTIHADNAEIPDFTRTCYNGEEDNLSMKHEYQIIGLIPDTDNEIVLTLTDASGKSEARSFTYKAPSLTGKGTLILTKENGESTQALTDGLYTVFAGDNFFYYYDNDGILRSEIPIIEYRNLRLIFNHDKMYYSAGKSVFVEMNALGRLTTIYDLGEYNLHHDYTFDDAGNILILGTDTTTKREEDRILYLNPETGELSQVLDLTDLFPEYYVNCKPDKEGQLDWMHINTIQWLGNGSVLLSSRETSSILRINDLFTKPSLQYMLGTDSFWKDTSYASFLFDKTKDFKGQLGQHSITYVPDSSLEDGQFYLYMFDNNIGMSTTRPDYKWSEHFDNIGSAGAPKKEETSFFYKYLVDENAKTYDLVESFSLPYSGFMSSVQEIGNNVIINSSNAKVFEEYDQDNKLIRTFRTGSKKQAYRTYKYTFDHFYFYTE